MDALDTAGADLEAAAEALRQHLGWQVTVAGPDGLQVAEGAALAEPGLELVRDGRHILLRIEHKARLKATDVPAIRARMRAGRGGRGATPLILLAPYINPTLARTLRDNGIPFVDTAGNLFLDLPGLFAWCGGNRPPPAVRERTQTVAALNHTGLRLAYALLNAPDLVGAPYRRLAAQVGISLGGVKLAMDYLARRGFVRDAGTRGRLLVNRRGLLDMWVEGYGTRLRRRLWIGRFQPRPGAVWQDLGFEPGEACWGGEVAAERLTGQLQAAEVVLHVRGTPGRLIARNGLRPGTAGTVTLLAAFWPGEDETAEGTAPPLAVYADLINTASSRNWEAAQQLYGRFLQGRIEGD